jgi:hypothetical protein
MADAIREAAEAILRDLGMWRLPVDPLRIAQEEGIELAPSHYGLGFDARIEYFHEFDRFGIYYQVPGPYRNAGRVHFSIGHELGHFYLPEHRQRLMAGSNHNSLSDYGSKSQAEKEADRFAAHLLMPQELFVSQVKLFHGGFCTLKNLCSMAERLGTSVASTAIRYCDCGIDAALVVLSKNRTIHWSWPSEDMRALGTWFVESGSRIPNGSKTAELYDRLEVATVDTYIEGSVSSRTWFDWPKRERLWEEAMLLGEYMLTYLAVVED